MIRSVVTTIAIFTVLDDGALLIFPLTPRLLGVAKFPDALTPHYVAQTEGVAVLHYPLGDGFALVAFALLFWRS